MSDVETYTTDRVLDADAEAKPVVTTTDLDEREAIRDAGSLTVGGDENLAALNELNPVTPPPVPESRGPDESRWRGVSFEPVAGGNPTVGKQAVALDGVDPTDAVAEFVNVARVVADGEEVDHGSVEDPSFDSVTGDQGYDPTEDLERHRVLQEKLAVGPAGAPVAAEQDDVEPYDSVERYGPDEG